MMRCKAREQSSREMVSVGITITSTRKTQNLRKRTKSMTNGTGKELDEGSKRNTNNINVIQENTQMTTKLFPLV